MNETWDNYAKRHCGNAIQLTSAQLHAAREWLADCSWADVEDDEFFSMDATSIIRGVARFYDGGLAGFVASFPQAA